METNVEINTTTIECDVLPLRISMTMSPQRTPGADSSPELSKVFLLCLHIWSTCLQTCTSFRDGGRRRVSNSALAFAEDPILTNQEISI